MSQTETHFGKLRKVETTLTLEEWSKEKCNKENITELASYNDNWVEELRDNFNNKYFIIDDEIWEAIEHIESEDGDDIDIMIPNSDGTITFVQQFYNGGTCLSECIEDGIKKLTKEK